MATVVHTVENFESFKVPEPEVMPAITDCASPVLGAEVGIVPVTEEVADLVTEQLQDTTETPEIVGEVVEIPKPIARKPRPQRPPRNAKQPERVMPADSLMAESPGKRQEKANGLSQDLVRQYIKEATQAPLLTKDDEVRLAQKIEAGHEAKRRLGLDQGGLNDSQRRKLQRQSREGEAARTSFIEANTRLVISIAKRAKYKNRGMELIDIIQEGNIGMFRAVDKFDWRKGFKFSTYATWWIQQAIERELANQGDLIRKPVHVYDQIIAYNKAVSILVGELGRSPNISEVASQINLPEDEVREIIKYRRLMPISLDQPINNESDSDTVGERYLADPRASSEMEGVAERLGHDEVISRLDYLLDERELDIIVSRFALRGGETETLEQVGKHWGITRERIRQLESRALAKLERDPVLKKLFDQL